MGKTLSQIEGFLQNLLSLRYREVMMTFGTMTVVFFTIVLFPGTDNVLAGIDGNVTATTVLGLFLIATLGAAVKGAVGFGPALITTPVFASVIDPVLTVVVLAVMLWMLNIYQIGETGTQLSYVKDEWPLVLFAVVGTVLGVYFLDVVSSSAVVPFLIGLLILAYVGYELLTNVISITGVDRPSINGTVGFVHGFLLASTNMGPVHPAYMNMIEDDIERYVGGLSVVFAIVQTIRLVTMYSTELLTPYRLWFGSAIATASIGGLLLGTYLRRLEFDQAKFDIAVVVLLFIIGVNLLRQAVPDLFF